MYKDSKGRVYTFWGYLHPKGEAVSTSYPVYANHRSDGIHITSPNNLTKEE